jgi:phage shock protein E
MPIHDHPYNAAKKTHVDACYQTAAAKSHAQGMLHDEDFIARVEKARSRIREITPMKLGNAMPPPIIIDVREKDEFELGHIEGAKLISQGMLEEQVAKVVPDGSTPIVVYCADGKRGALTADILQNMGYQKISSLKGGLTSWLESGGIVETGSTETDLRRQKNISVSETDTDKSAKWLWHYIFAWMAG